MKVQFTFDGISQDGKKDYGTFNRRFYDSDSDDYIIKCINKELEIYGFDFTYDHIPSRREIILKPNSYDVMRITIYK